ncbi:MAG: ring-cleaving dioxygenase [Bacteroidia bacterium]|jgi:glyoxalase family protein|nr:ring-cleaving dioxygenase [Bacteroidia bacterium]GIV24118.1 MAG: glyoxalase [Bacteroidia bacterium]
MEEEGVLGFHHATGFAGEAQKNVDFYTGVLGLRLVKRSVNQDEPHIYHLFYADKVGSPGTEVTFFPWPGMARRRIGTGLITEVALAVPEGSLPYWQKRLESAGFSGELSTEAGRAALRLADPEGLPLLLVEEPAENRPFGAWAEGPVPVEYQIRGICGVQMVVSQVGQTDRLLTAVLGFEQVAGDKDFYPYRIGRKGDWGYGFLAVKVAPDLLPGRWGRGSLHHVAWRVRDEAHLLALRSRLEAVGLHPTPVIDRFWFKSVYFREPGGVIFELATDGPGFTVDEDPQALGEKLVLPPWLEPYRAEIEAHLPPLEYPPAYLREVSSGKRLQG